MSKKESKKQFSTFNILIKAIHNDIRPDALTNEHTGYSKETIDHQQEQGVAIREGIDCERKKTMVNLLKRVEQALWPYHFTVIQVYLNLTIVIYLVS